MFKINSEKSKRFFKCIAMVLTIILIMNQSGIVALASEASEGTGQQGSGMPEITGQPEGAGEETPAPEVPGQEAAELEIPGTEAQGQDAPGADVPGQETPGTEVPGQEAVVPEIPGTEASGTDVPGQEVPGTETAGEETSGTEMPTEDPASQETESTESEESGEEAANGDGKIGETAVATQDELAAAFLACVPKIKLTADIYLTSTLTVANTADIELDGQGFSLSRGADENGAFTGTMLYISDTGVTEGASAALTLKNICLNGWSPQSGDRADSSVILNYGSLRLGEGAVIKGNHNYGTYKDGGDGGIINDYGGGIQVYGMLAVSESALVTENFADEFGGGVYLADGAALYLYADVIKENAVPDGTGYGADLYAANGSTVYYASTVDMTREGFYICDDAVLEKLDGGEAVADATVDDNVEIFLNVPLSKDGGKDGRYTKEQVDEIERQLKLNEYKVLSNRTNIDTTDLRDWYVYDHYDMNAWELDDDPRETWENRYTENDKRHNYVYNETYYNDLNGTTNNMIYRQLSTVTKPVYTIDKWLTRQDSNKQDDYCVDNYGVTLAQFKEHIYTRKVNDSPTMTFVGYGKSAYVDFLFYDPASRDGEKVVNFDVNSTQVQTHTLTGTGFLVNTGITPAGMLVGYLIYYEYLGGTIPDSVAIYPLNINADSLHNGDFDLRDPSQKNIVLPLKNRILPNTEQPIRWAGEMSIQIKTTSKSIKVWQKPINVDGNQSESTFTDRDMIFDIDISECNYSGFGPLVAYKSHGCFQASSFTYSNLRMYYTNPELQQGDMLSPLEKVDFTQKGTQKYFINLFGKDEKAGYDQDGVEKGKYQDYLTMMQTEGIALITDRETPFAAYLGDNLCEVSGVDSEGKINIEDLAKKITAYIGSKTTTNIKDKLKRDENSPGLTEAKPTQPVGNIWLSASDGSQIRETLKGDSFPGSGYKIQIEDIAVYGDPKEPSQYEVTKPEPDGTTVKLDGNVLVVGKNRSTWPPGRYTVKQTIIIGKNDDGSPRVSSVEGYAYFELEWNDAPDAPPAADGDVTIMVNKDGDTWSDSGKSYALTVAGSGSYITNLSSVPNDTYNVCEIISDTGGNTYVDTGVPVTVSGPGATATVNYYTVTANANDGVSPPQQQIVLSGQKAVKPADPTRPNFGFSGWFKESGEAFDFSTQTITATTTVTAGWTTNKYAVKISVNKDDAAWDNHGKAFCLKKESAMPVIAADEADGELYMLLADEPADAWITDFTNLEAGTYRVHEVAGGAAEPVDTGVTVTVNGADASVGIDYYTVTFYDADTPYGGDSAQAPQIVLKGKNALAPADPAAKAGYTFYRWSPLKDDSSTDFNFKSPIMAKTNVYASWNTIPKFTITASAGAGGSIAPSGEIGVQLGDNQQFIITPDNGYRIDAVLVDGTDVTGNLIDIAEAYKLREAGVNNQSGAKQYAFQKVEAPHTIEAKFKALPVKRKSSGGITPPGPPDYVPPAAVPVNNAAPNIIPDAAPVPDAVPVPADAPTSPSRDNEPKTGDDFTVEIYATLAMIAGLLYLLLYFADGQSGMTEEQKKEIVGAIVRWARKGGRLRKYAAISVIFLILVYYHSIGKRTVQNWKELYEE